MSAKQMSRISCVLLLSVMSAGIGYTAEVTSHVYADFVGTLSGTSYTLGFREIDTTGTFAAHNGTEIVSDGLGTLSDADEASQESFEFDAAAFSNNGSEFTGTAFIAEAIFTPTAETDSMAPIIDIGGQCFIRFHTGLSAGSWDGSTEVSNNDIQDIPDTGQTHHYAIVYDGADTIDYYLDGVAIFQSDNGSPQGITSLISWGNIRHPSVDGGRQLRGQYEAVAFSTFTGDFDPEADFILPEGPVSPALASDPEPIHEAQDVLRDTVLNWAAGEYAATHDVYLGIAFDDVNEARRANPMDVLVSQGQSDTAYDPGRLEFGQTYYWRIDEVNAAPDNTIYQGEVWSFAVEPLAYPIEGVVATSNGVSDEGEGPENTVNRSGLNADDQHSVESGDMWSATPSEGETLWIQFEFNRVYKLHVVQIWNYNVQFELLLGFGFKNVTVEYSEDGADWSVLGDVELAQATAQPTYTYGATIDFAGAAARYVRLTVIDGYGTRGSYGLSEVRFMYVPAQAREAEPADGATEVDVAAELSWRAGREAVSHEVYLSDDADAVVAGTALLDTVTVSSYVPGDLAFGTTYYWKVTEVNEAEAIGSWEGTLWSFTTQEYGLIEDFEAYDDDENRIYDTWLDGWVNGTGAVVGYGQEPFAETGIVHGGRQSMPLEYDNSGAPYYSEAQRDLGGVDLTGGGADTLRLHVYGSADNEADTLYVAIEDTSGNVAAASHPDQAAGTTEAWQEWTIPFADLGGVNLAAVQTIYVGVGDRDNPNAGGAGLIFIDDVAFGNPADD